MSPLKPTIPPQAVGCPVGKTLPSNPIVVGTPARPAEQGVLGQKLPAPGPTAIDEKMRADARGADRVAGAGKTDGCLPLLLLLIATICDPVIDCIINNSSNINNSNNSNTSSSSSSYTKYIFIFYNINKCNI